MLLAPAGDRGEGARLDVGKRDWADSQSSPRLVDLYQCPLAPLCPNTASSPGLVAFRPPTRRPPAGQPAPPHGPLSMGAQIVRP